MVVLFLSLFLFGTTAGADHKLTYEQLVQKSENFHQEIYNFPLETNRINTITSHSGIGSLFLKLIARCTGNQSWLWYSNTTKQQEVVAHAKSTRPILHAKVLTLCEDFLEHKRQHGSVIEKELYKGMDTNKFINRLLSKRPLVFYRDGAVDRCLIKGEKNCRFDGNSFDNIGTSSEREPFLLANYLSYDEMQISALIGVAGGTHFINKGDRKNKGIPGKPGSYLEQGVLVGLVGARFEKNGFMEHEHMVVTNDKRTRNPDLVRIWQKFYQGKKTSTSNTNTDNEPDYDTIAKTSLDRYIKIPNQEAFFDITTYKKRLKYVLLPFLCDANRRGLESNKKVYLHVVGLGLGVWQLLPEQAKFQIEVYEKLFKKYKFSHISDINFSWFGDEYQKIGKLGNGETIDWNENNIKVHFSKRDPADLLPKGDAEKLVVAQYPWDSNAYPGNEYWVHKFSTSGDPAAACCSTIAELHNPLINSYVSTTYMAVYNGNDLTSVTTTVKADPVKKPTPTTRWWGMLRRGGTGLIRFIGGFLRFFGGFFR